VLGAAGIRTFVATSPETARGALADAANAALQGGAVALLLPVNVSSPSSTSPRHRRRRPSRGHGRRRRRGRRHRAAVALWRQSRKPLIVAGLGRRTVPAPRPRSSSWPTGSARCWSTSARGKDLFRGHPAISASSGRSRIRPRGR
jgi:hypothetical protein